VWIFYRGDRGSRLLWNFDAHLTTVTRRTHVPEYANLNTNFKPHTQVSYLRLSNANDWYSIIKYSTELHMTAPCFFHFKTCELQICTKPFVCRADGGKPMLCVRWDGIPVPRYVCRYAHTSAHAARSSVRTQINKRISNVLSAILRFNSNSGMYGILELLLIYHFS
jgi:hypothetical protein